jgi:hypothetical protein
MTQRTAPMRTDLDRHRLRTIRKAPSTVDELPFRDVRMLLAVTGLTWWLLLFAALAVMPEAVDPAASDAELTATEQLVGLLQMSVLLAVVLALMAGSPVAAGGAMLVGGVVFLASSVACVSTGHHSFGGWWYVQAGAMGGMIVAGAAALRSGLVRRR